MKKILVAMLFVFFVTACGSNGFDNMSKRTIEDLLDGYVEAYTKADDKIAKRLFPSFYVEYNKNNITKERLEKALNNAKERYGNDFDITYEVTKKTKLDDDELREINEKMRKFYSSQEDASECYKVDGTITFKGEKKEDTSSMATIRYCKYDGLWYLLAI